MSIIGLLLITLAKVLHLIVNVYTFIVLGAVIISWVKPDPYNPIVRFLNQATEPVFSFIRSKMPSALNSTGMDFTPIIVFVALIVVDTFFVQLIMDIGIELRHSPVAMDVINNMSDMQNELPSL
jgi:YggT family protein